MKLIIDCNVLVSAGLKEGLCRKVVKQSFQVGTLYLSKEIILEYLLVSRRNKFKDHQLYLEELIELLARAARIINPMPSSYILPDPQDKKYIDLAVSIQADFLITGNLRDFPEKRYEETQVVSPRDFFYFLASKASF